MIICSGTSRLVVVQEEALPADREAALADILLGVPHGLGGHTSQTCKIATVSPDSGDHFKFHFYQMVRSTRAVLPTMECSNAASATALFALLNSLCEPGDRRMETKNTATGQRINLFLPPKHGEHEHPWEGDWTVRFLFDPGIRERFKTARETKTAHLSDRSISYRQVLHGNLFIFCDVDPKEMTPAMSEAIATCVRAEWPRHIPKIIPFRAIPQRESGTCVHLEAASFFHGERHGSLPGSAAMALGLFMGLCEPHCLSEESEQHVFDIEHQGGASRVRLRLENGEPVYTEFDTPVRLLMRGYASLPCRVCANHEEHKVCVE